MDSMMSCLSFTVNKTWKWVIPCGNRMEMNDASAKQTLPVKEVGQARDHVDSLHFIE